MNRKQYERWLKTVDLTATYTCRRCGKTGQGYYVQPQPDGGALCVECIGELNRQAREERKRQLAAMPRCAVPNCRRRATRWHPNRNSGTGLCGHHWRRVEEYVYRQQVGDSFFWMLEPIVLSREELIKAATTKFPDPGQEERR